MDENYNLRGLITIKDIEKNTKYPNSAKDANGRLLCGAAVGVTHDVFDRIDALLASKVDVISIDTAHGHSVGVLHQVEAIRKRYPNIQLFAGNVATAAATHDLISAGVELCEGRYRPGLHLHHACGRRALAYRRLLPLRTARRRPTSTACTGDRRRRHQVFRRHYQGAGGGRVLP